MDLNLFARGILDGIISLEKAEQMQDKMESEIKKKSKKHNSRIQARKDLRNIILDNGQKLFEGRDAIFEVFRKHIFYFLNQILNQIPI